MRIKSSAKITKSNLPRKGVQRMQAIRPSSAMMSRLRPDKDILFYFLLFLKTKFVFVETIAVLVRGCLQISALSVVPELKFARK